MICWASATKPVFTKLVEQTVQRKQEMCQVRPASDINLPPPESETTEFSKHKIDTANDYYVLV